MFNPKSRLVPRYLSPASAQAAWASSTLMGAAPAFLGCRPTGIPGLIQAGAVRALQGVSRQLCSTRTYFVAAATLGDFHVLAFGVVHQANLVVGLSQESIEKIQHANHMLHETSATANRPTNKTHLRGKTQNGMLALAK